MLTLYFLAAFTGGLHQNMKTYRSVDFTTMCPRLRQGKPCRYCYVQANRNNTWFAKLVVEDIPYDGCILRMRKETIDRLNLMGGIRLFASSDFLPKHADRIRTMLDDCSKVGLSAKAITKRLDFIRRFHKHPAISAINLSIDFLKRGGGPHKLVDAKRARDRYSKVFIRSVALSRAEAEEQCENPDIDVVTLNHGTNGFHVFRHAEAAELAMQYPMRLCCETHVCDGCDLRCGLGGHNGERGRDPLRDNG